MCKKLQNYLLHGLRHVEIMDVFDGARTSVTITVCGEPDGAAEWITLSVSLYRNSSMAKGQGLTLDSMTCRACQYMYVHICVRLSLGSIFLIL